MSASGQALALAACLFLFGAAAVGVSARRSDPARRRELWTAYRTTVLIAAAVLVPSALHPALFALAAALAACRCAYELAALHGVRVSHAGAAIVAAASGAAAWFGAISQSPDGIAAFLAVTALALVLSAPPYARALVRPAAGRSAWIVALVFPLIAAAQLSHLVHREAGFLWVFLLYATVEVHDSAAYVAGRLFGRRRLLPRLSPRKTVFGAAAGIACGLAAGTLVASVLLGQPFARSLGLAALLVAAGIAGDLFTSALKRAAGAKDFRPVHALHGGLLDIYDSTLFAALPLSAALWLLGVA